MRSIYIEQALYGDQDVGGYRFLARSAGFRDEWLPEAERLCTRFGERPANVACPESILAQPFGKGHVAVVRVADQGHDDTGRPGALAFQLLILSWPDYAYLLADPFAIAERCPPVWQTRGELSPVVWPDVLPTAPRVAELREILQNNDAPTLLGGVQALIEGRRLVFERSAPAPHLVRSLWQLLPISSRCELWPASFAFGNAMRWDVVVVPKAEGADYADYLIENRIGDFPEGRYERNLQIAIEDGDQQAVEALLLRRSSRQMMTLALWIIGGMLALSLVANLFNPTKFTQDPPPATAPRPNLKAAAEYPPLSAADRERLTAALRAWGVQLEVELSATATATEWLSAIDQKLNSAAPRPLPPPPPDEPVERRLRALLWKYAVAAYDDPKLNVVELVERWQEQVGSPPSPEGTMP
ncbi:MAG: hypothetical protein ACK4RK_02080 [Gemmataceae bacterium]